MQTMDTIPPLSFDLRQLRVLDAECASYQYAHWITPWVVRGLPKALQ